MLTELGYFIILLAAGILALYLQSYNQGKPLEAIKYSDFVSYVHDGDTIFLPDKTALRLWGVDAPELDEVGGAEAKQFLHQLVDQKQISYIKMHIDDYDRIVARIFLKDGREVNRLLIESVFTKEYCKYSKNYYGHCV